MTRATSLAAAVLIAAFSTAPAAAQHAPLIERMSDGAAPNATASDNNASAAPATAASSTVADLPRSQIGDTTRALLRMQADGSHAGNALPMLGEAASRSYQRYLNSFDHPIPEYFEAALPNSKQGGGSR
ncbi:MULTISPECIES: DUF3613 domain-containing protein [Stenotrophomonas]|uniref:DUF3613 domain-containing protein n=1 Tax=Stenotrophomonas TaxID=40323 RepID=UPI0007705E95|nr:MULTISPECIES: DUF3613 domain-containing protein [Stenotrophomonas]AMJ57133.1 hypothetical protein AXG53_11145 [Stenotrophomonas sp. KCTC 12332]